MINTASNVIEITITSATKECQNLPFNGSQSDSKGFFLFGIKRFQKMIKLQYDVVHHRCIEVEELSVVQDAIGFTSHKTLLISFGREMLRFYHDHDHDHHHDQQHHHHHDDVGDHQADNSRRTTPSLPPTGERCRTASTLLRSDIHSINIEDCHGDDDDDNDDNDDYDDDDDDDYDDDDNDDDDADSKDV